MTGPVGIGQKAGVPGTSHPTSSIPRRFSPRVPLLPAAVALAFGIVADRTFKISETSSFVIAIVAASAAILLQSWPRLASVLLALALAGLGAARHHQLWTTRPADDVSRIEVADDSPVRVIGVVESPIDIRRSE